jgi:glucose-6-phosphate isomerase
MNKVLTAESFEDYIKNERESFEAAIRNTWYFYNLQERGAIENLLIAYDQMAEKLEAYKNQSPVSEESNVSSQEPDATASKEIGEPLVQNKSNQ